MQAARRLLDLIRRAWAGLAAPAEDPRKVFASRQTRQSELLAEIHGSLADVAMLKNDLAALVTSAAARLPQLQDEARAALEGGRDDLARHIVERSVVAAQELDELRVQLTELEAEERRLLSAERRLAAQVESFSAHQQMAAARLTTSEAHVRVNESLRSMARELEALGIALEETEDRVETMQARAGEIDGLLLTAREEGSAAEGQKAIDQKLADRNLQSRVETELGALRRRKR